MLRGPYDAPSNYNQHRSPLTAHLLPTCGLPLCQPLTWRQKMLLRCLLRFILSLLALTCGVVVAGDGNRLAYLDDPINPYYVGRGFPKLTTPMWVGDDGVEAVVVLAIDDMRGHEKWEQYLRPILDRL